MTCKVGVDTDDSKEANCEVVETVSLVACNSVLCGKIGWSVGSSCAGVMKCVGATCVGCKVAFHVGLTNHGRLKWYTWLWSPANNGAVLIES